MSGVAADALGRWTGRGVGVGSAIVIQAAGGLMALIAVSMLTLRSIRSLEKEPE